METGKSTFAVHVALAASIVVYLGAGGCADEAEPAGPEAPALSFPGADLDASNAGTDAGAPHQSPGAPGGPTPQADAAAIEGLPCDIGAFLQARCTSCHGNPPLPGVPSSLVSYTDLTKPSTQPSQTVAQRALELIRSGAMPPGGLNANDSQSFAAWVQAGAQPGSCTSDAGVDASTPPPSMCTSQQRWRGGNEGSPRMHPGKACIACHTSSREEDGPRFSIAGTVYPSLFEPDDCNGTAASGVQVVVKGADGRVLTLTPNAAGNFYAEGQRVALPYTAELHYQGRVRAMAEPQSNGDCNGCHTERGASGAPGRIFLP